MDNKPNERKRTSGAIRDKDRTKNKMIQAVGKVLLKKGYTGLNASTIAKEAEVDKRLVWTYFGGLDPLVEEYISRRDFWKFTATDSINDLLGTNNGIKKEQVSDLLKSQFETLLYDNVLQRIIHWELSENKSFLRNISNQREAIGEELFKHIAHQFNNETKQIRAITALLIGGIYYLALHGKVNGSLFCGLDINKEEDKLLINKTIEEIIAFAFGNAVKINQ
ncbi:MAG: TetR/AcrR family transcriptional regulator [Myroides sp.]|nr:TetR/AcrR family transcriptional regulator [Myroides sp.]